MRKPRILRRLFGRRGHTNPVPEGRARLIVLTDYFPLDYIGDRAWCDAKRRPCDECGGRCCACRHHERRNEDTDDATAR